MRRSLRVLALVCVFLAILTFGLYLAARVYLSSNSFRRAFANRLETSYGGPVEIENADVGVLGGSTLHGLRLYEPDQPRHVPWARQGP